MPHPMPCPVGTYIHGPTQAREEMPGQSLSILHFLGTGAVLHDLLCATPSPSISGQADDQVDAESFVDIILRFPRAVDAWYCRNWVLVLAPCRAESPEKESYKKKAFKYRCKHSMQILARYVESLDGCRLAQILLQDDQLYPQDSLSALPNKIKVENNKLFMPLIIDAVTCTLNPRVAKVESMNGTYRIKRRTKKRNVKLLHILVLRIGETVYVRQVRKSHQARKGSR
jgi:hypothetical protein